MLAEDWTPCHGPNSVRGIWPLWPPGRLLGPLGGLLWPSVASRDLSWPFVAFRGLSWAPVASRGIPCSLVVSHGLPWSLVAPVASRGHCVLPWPPVVSALTPSMFLSAVVLSTLTPWASPRSARAQPVHIFSAHTFCTSSRL